MLTNSEWKRQQFDYDLKCGMIEQKRKIKFQEGGVEKGVV